MGRIVIDKNIRHGKPVIRGTRVPVDLILGSMAGGMSYKEICEDYEKYTFSRQCSAQDFIG